MYIVKRILDWTSGFTSEHRLHLLQTSFDTNVKYLGISSWGRDSILTKYQILFAFLSTNNKVYYYAIIEVHIAIVAHAYILTSGIVCLLNECKWY